MRRWVNDKIGKGEISLEILVRYSSFFQVSGFPCRPCLGLWRESYKQRLRDVPIPWPHGLLRAMRASLPDQLLLTCVLSSLIFPHCHPRLFPLFQKSNHMWFRKGISSLQGKNAIQCRKETKNELKKYFELRLNVEQTKDQTDIEKCFGEGQGDSRIQIDGQNVLF